ncbi:uncharacterized protein LOC120351238 [Nilaparvata lugens]|uniref:uncharacterized protein LOC120351238 n=1 Tax=Nilaparvata lugens TaxID=108931 RepID=UPI00193D3EF2|nr:uncharacterized protein LOC120351238 [Nilaparvata lugens]
MVYGQVLRLPGEFLTPNLPTGHTHPSTFVTNLRSYFNALRPVKGTRHGERTPFVFKDLATCQHVFVRTDTSKGALEPPYSGPHLVISRTDKTAVVKIQGSDITISMDRLKPAFIMADDDQPISISQTIPPATASPLPDAIQDPLPDSDTPAVTTRSGRRVHFPDRLQAGVS